MAGDYISQSQSKFILVLFFSFFSLTFREASIKFGPMMLATLHGLTRSRPDLLAESLATFSTFSSPSRMPKDEIGSHLEAKLAEGEVLREFERIPKKKQPIGNGYEQLFRTATLAENIPLNRFKDVLPYDENRVKLAAGDKGQDHVISTGHQMLNLVLNFE